MDGLQMTSNLEQEESEDCINAYIERLVDAISCIGPSNNDIIAVRFLNTLCMDKLNLCIQYLVEKFPDKTIVALPRDIYLETWNRDVLDFYIQEFMRIAKEME